MQANSLYLDFPMYIYNYVRTSHPEKPISLLKITTLTLDFISLKES